MESERASPGRFNRMCVFCGSSSGKKSVYSEVAAELGKELAQRSIDLVYGGGSIGLMGTVAKTVQDAGGHVVGIIPKALMPREITGKTVGDVVAVDNMHQRKAEMALRADAFIALPGGYGTFEELLEIVTWSQLGIHSKPVGVLNVDGYYDSLLALFDKSLDEGFLNLASRLIVVAAPTARELLDQMEAYAPVQDDTVPKLSWEVTTATSLLSTTTSTPRRETRNVRTTYASATVPQQKASESASKPLISMNANYNRQTTDDILSSSLRCITSTCLRLPHPVARISRVNRIGSSGPRERNGSFHPISPSPRASVLSGII